MHKPEPYVEMHPEDAVAACVANDGFARVTTQHGSCVLQVVVSEGQRKGSLFAPIHWSAETSSSARIGDLVAPHTDPYSGQPESKATPAAAAPVAFAFRGFVIARQPIALPDRTWWARASIPGGYGYLLATNEDHAAWREYGRSLFGGNGKSAEYVDAPWGIYRAAAFANGRLEICLFIGPANAVPQWDAVKAQFTAESLGAQQRRLLLSGRDADGVTDTGPIICACFGVGLAAIREAIASRNAANVEEVGKALRAGTNCGSCLPELKRIIADGRVADPI